MKRVRVTAKQAQRAVVGSLSSQIEMLELYIKGAQDETRRAELQAQLNALRAKNAAQWR